MIEIHTSSSPTVASMNGNVHQRRTSSINIEKFDIKPSSYIPTQLLATLVIAKALRAIGLGIAKNTLLSTGRIPASIVTCGVLFTASIIVLGWVRPWSGRPVPATKYRKIAMYAAVLAAQQFTFFLALARVSALRVVLLSQYADVWVISLVSSLAKPGMLYGQSKTAMTRGAQFAGAGLLVGILSDILFAPKPLAPEHKHEQVEDTPSPYVPSSASIAFGYACLMLSIWLRGYLRTLGKRTGTEVGGQRRLYAFALPVAATILAPLAFLQQTMAAPSIPSFFPSLPLYIFLGAALIAVDYFSEYGLASGVAIGRHILSGWPVSVALTAIIGLIGFKAPISIADLIVTGLVYQAISQVQTAAPQLLSDAQYSPNPQASPGGFEYANGGAKTESFEKTLKDLNGYLQVILENQDSRQIFYFLLLNLSYMFVQLLYGVWTNSLGLISDAIHMFFDCLALAVGLFASVMAKWSANSTFSYGYNRIETLSGFANAIFLVLISVFIIFEAIQRLMDPPDMNTNQLLLVSFLGLLVNLVGIFAFNHGHAHGGHGHSHGGHDHGHGHGHSHNHSHAGHDQGHSHGHDHGYGHGHTHAGHSHGHAHGHNANMHGVFLHVLADTLGSVGVIISTLLINQFGWTGFDPIASIFIAALIFMSVVPLIQESGRVLLLFASPHHEEAVRIALDELLSIPGVASFGAPRFWPNDDSSCVGSIHIHAHDGVDRQALAYTIEQHLKSHIDGLGDLTIQMEPVGGLRGCFCGGKGVNRDDSRVPESRISSGVSDMAQGTTTGIQPSIAAATATATGPAHSSSYSASGLNGVAVS